MKIDKIVFYLRDIANNTLRLENNPVKAYARLTAVLEEIERDEAFEMDKEAKYWKKQGMDIKNNYIKKNG